MDCTFFWILLLTCDCLDCGLMASPFLCNFLLQRIQYDRLALWAGQNLTLQLRHCFFPLTVVVLNSSFLAGLHPWLGSYFCFGCLFFRCLRKPLTLRYSLLQSWHLQVSLVAFNSLLLLWAQKLKSTCNFRMCLKSPLYVEKCFVQLRHLNFEEPIVLLFDWKVERLPCLYNTWRLRPIQVRKLSPQSLHWYGPIRWERNLWRTRANFDENSLWQSKHTQTFVILVCSPLRGDGELLDSNDWMHASRSCSFCILVSATALISFEERLDGELSLLFFRKWCPLWWPRIFFEWNPFPHTSQLNCFGGLTDDTLSFEPGTNWEPDKSLLGWGFFCRTCDEEVKGNAPRDFLCFTIDDFKLFWDGLRLWWPVWLPKAFTDLNDLLQILQIKAELAALLREGFSSDEELERSSLKDLSPLWEGLRLWWAEWERKEVEVSNDLLQILQLKVALRPSSGEEFSFNNGLARTFLLPDFWLSKTFCRLWWPLCAFNDSSDTNSFKQISHWCIPFDAFPLFSETFGCNLALFFNFRCLVAMCKAKRRLSLQTFEHIPHLATLNEGCFSRMCFE